jgi:hypothetical protein
MEPALITVFKTARHCSRSWARGSTSRIPVLSSTDNIHFNIILPRVTYCNPGHACTNPWQLRTQWNGRSGVPTLIQGPELLSATTPIQWAHAILSRGVKAAWAIFFGVSEYVELSHLPITGTLPFHGPCSCCCRWEQTHEPMSLRTSWSTQLLQLRNLNIDHRTYRNKPRILSQFNPV